MLKINFQLCRNAFGQLMLTDAQGQFHENIFPVRPFPISAPDDGIALINAEGSEVAWVDHIADLPSDIAQLIEEELASREFVPEIENIRSVSSYACPSIWQVQTNRGETCLTLKGEEDIRRLSQTQLLIADKDGIQFLIRDLTTLDWHSRKLLDRFL